jgi:prolipoprotein diacylglyceryltransferase
MVYTGAILGLALALFLFIGPTYRRTPFRVVADCILAGVILVGVYYLIGSKIGG